jgi:hypothetical protein
VTAFRQRVDCLRDNAERLETPIRQIEPSSNPDDLRRSGTCAPFEHLRGYLDRLQRCACAESFEHRLREVGRHQPDATGGSNKAASTGTRIQLAHAFNWHTHSTGTRLYGATTNWPRLSQGFERIFFCSLLAFHANGPLFLVVARAGVIGIFH